MADGEALAPEAEPLTADHAEALADPGASGYDVAVAAGSYDDAGEVTEAPPLIGGPFDAVEDDTPVLMATEADTELPRHPPLDAAAASRVGRDNDRILCEEQRPLAASGEAEDAARPEEADLSAAREEFAALATEEATCCRPADAALAETAPAIFAEDNKENAEALEGERQAALGGCNEKSMSCDVEITAEHKLRDATERPELDDVDEDSVHAPRMTYQSDHQPMVEPSPEVPSPASALHTPMPPMPTPLPPLEEQAVHAAEDESGSALAAAAAPNSGDARRPAMLDDVETTAPPWKPLSSVETPLPSPRGLAEARMQEMVQEQMSSLLEPLTAHIKTLHEQLQKLSSDIGVLTERVDGNVDIIDKHSQDLMRTELFRTKVEEDLDVKRIQILGLGEKQVGCEMQHQRTAVGLKKAYEAFQGVSAAVGQLQQKNAETDERLADLSSRTDEGKEGREALAADIAEIRQMHEGMNDRQLLAEARLQEVKSLAEDAKQKAKDLKCKMERKDREVEKSFFQLDERSRGLEASVDDIMHLMKQQKKGVADLKRFTDELQSGMTSLNDTINAQAEAQREAEKKSQESLEEVKDSVAKGVDTRKTLAQAITERFERLERHTKCHIAKLQEHEELLQALDAKMAENKGELMERIEQVGQNSENALNDQLEGQRERLGMLEEAQSLQSQRLDGLEVRSAELFALSADVSKHLAAHDTELERVRWSVKDTDDRLAAVRAELKQLRSEYTGTVKDVTKTSHRVDLAHEYFDGLGRGFESTHQKVLGMLQPRADKQTSVSPAGAGASSAGRTLPVVPTPRAPPR
eukprot:TRINITY_DN22118_c0_g1_i1.p1 TRINITY_DN22118_c0_g1~~TRINITY_DN22118_c0_g1_i1.p1  ORF type:complete len:812 (+),score=254.23 TRINITY_DN22118_c0_g1_i1:74-2509(+)